MQRLDRKEWQCIYSSREIKHTMTLNDCPIENAVEYIAQGKYQCLRKDCHE